MDGAAANDVARFTPTGVGTMLVSPGNQVLTPVHPHGRGDNPIEAT